MKSDPHNLPADSDAPPRTSPPPLDPGLEELRAALTTTARNGKRWRRFLRSWRERLRSLLDKLR